MLKNIGVGVVINGCIYPSYRTLKLAVYHKNINSMTCFLYVYIIIETLSYRESHKISVVDLSLLSVFQLKIFLRNRWLLFSPIDKTVDNWNILKLTEPSFPGKLIFSKIRAKSGKMTPKQDFFGFFGKILASVFLRNILEKNIIVIDISLPIPYLETFSERSRDMNQNDVTQLNCKLFKT